MKIGDWTFVTVLAFGFMNPWACSSKEKSQTDASSVPVDSGEILACDSEPEIMTTADGVEFVVTPSSCFDDLPGFPYTMKYLEIDGLRQAYVDEGPVDSDPILLLHGEPSWSYLYRKMIPVLVNAGHRVIAMDHIGFGRSDKPIDIAYYSYLGHNDRLVKFIQELGLSRITLFCQDWGSLIGLRVAGLNPEWFARIVVGEGRLPVVPAGYQVVPLIENPNEIDDTLVSPFANMPPQQPDLRDDDGELLFSRDPDSFGNWAKYAMKASTFHPAEVLEAMTYFDLPSDEEAAYDAPYPSRIYLAGPRVFPYLANELEGKNFTAWEGLTQYTKPLLTTWAANDPSSLGDVMVQNLLIDNVPGAAGQEHVRLEEASHFLQDDQGAEIARRMNELIANTP